MSRGLLVVVVGAVALVMVNVHSVEADFLYPDFSSTAGLQLIGPAQGVGGVLRLTHWQQDTRGAAWRLDKARVVAGFDTSFQFQITGDGVHNVSDGFAFVIQNQSWNAVGARGGGLGYGVGPSDAGISNSVAVEFDTWDNGEEFPDPVSRLPGGSLGTEQDHISVQTRGLLENSPDHTYSLGSTDPADPVANSIGDGNVHEVRIVYVPGSMDVFMDDMSSPILSVSLDLAATLDLDNGGAWVGFTAGNGGGVSYHDILTWQFTEIPEPATAGLLIAGWLGLLLRRR